jgi:hypothetical protein
MIEKEILLDPATAYSCLGKEAGVGEDIINTVIGWMENSQPGKSMSEERKNMLQSWHLSMITNRIRDGKPYKRMLNKKYFIMYDNILELIEELKLARKQGLL